MKYIRKATLCMKSIEQTEKIQDKENREKHKRKPNNRKITKEKGEQRKEERESLDMSLHARDQSKRVPLKEASI